MKFVIRFFVILMTFVSGEVGAVQGSPDAYLCPAARISGLEDQMFRAFSTFLYSEQKAEATRYPTATFDPTKMAIYVERIPETGEYYYHSNLAPGKTDASPEQSCTACMLKLRSAGTDWRLVVAKMLQVSPVKETNWDALSRTDQKRVLEVMFHTNFFVRPDSAQSLNLIDQNIRYWGLPQPVHLVHFKQAGIWYQADTSRVRLEMYDRGWLKKDFVEELRKLRRKGDWIERESTDNCYNGDLTPKMKDSRPICGLD